MGNLQSNIGHIVTAGLVIVATTILAWHGTITGSDAIVLIAGVAGFSMGGSVASSSTGAAVSGSASAPVSTQTFTSIPSATTTTTTPAIFPSQVTSETSPA